MAGLTSTWNHVCCPEPFLDNPTSCGADGVAPPSLTTPGAPPPPPAEVCLYGLAESVSLGLPGPGCCSWVLFHKNLSSHSHYEFAQSRVLSQCENATRIDFNASIDLLFFFICQSLNNVPNIVFNLILRLFLVHAVAIPTSLSKQRG